MKKIWLCLAVVALLPGLNGCRGKAGSEGPLPVLDFRADIPKKDVALQELGKVRYFRLQTPENVLLGDQMKLVPSEAGLFFFEPSIGDVIGFNKKGEMISRFNRKGQGGEEYARIRHILYDDQRREVFLDGFTQMQVYGLDGSYKKSFNFPDSLQMDVVESLDKNTMVFLDMKGVPFVKEGETADLGERQESSNRPYVLMDKETGKKIERLPIVSDNRYRSMIITTRDGRPFVLLNRMRNLLSCNGGGCLISEPAADTLYQLSSDRQLKPVFSKLPLSIGKEGKIACEIRALTPNQMLVNAVFLKDESEMKLRNELYLYNVAENAFSQVKLTNKDWQNGDMMNFVFNNNKLYYTLYPFTLLEAMEKNELDGELLEITKTLDEDDNLILMEVSLD